MTRPGVLCPVSTSENEASFDTTGISFRIHQDGTITDVGVALSSRFEPLDVASLNAINNTNPPPLPDHVDDEYVPIKFGFYYNLRPNY